jgi:hypothetical protein
LYEQLFEFHALKHVFVEEMANGSFGLNREPKLFKKYVRVLEGLFDMFLVSLLVTDEQYSKEDLTEVLRFETFRPKSINAFTLLFSKLPNNWPTKARDFFADGLGDFTKKLDIEEICLSESKDY